MFPFDFLREPLWQPLTWTLLHFLWQGLVIVVMVTILRYLLPIRRAQHRYLVNLAALMAMAICPVATFILLDATESSTVASHHDSAIESAAPIESDPKPTEMAHAEPPANPIMLPAPENGVSPETIETIAIVPVLPDTSESMEIVPDPAPAYNQFQPYITAIQPYALILWIVGILFFGARLLISWLHVRWLRWGCQSISDELAATAVALSKRLGLRFPPRVYASEKIREAIVVGLWRPLVLLPTSWLTLVPPEVLEAVIAHELAHIRRFDLWVNLLQRLMETILFYHPAVWYLSRRVSVEREMCADDLAVCATKDRLLYVTALERLGRMRLSPNAPRLGTSIGGNKMALLNRVGNLLGLSAPNKKARWWPVGLLTIAIPLMIWLVSMNFGSPAEHKAQAEPPSVEKAEEKDDSMPVEPKDEEKDKLKWGPVHNGLQLAVELLPKKETYLLGETIDVRFHVRNTTDSPVQISLESSLRQEMYRKSVLIHDEHGKPITGQPVLIWVDGDIATQQVTVEPGKTFSYDSSDLAFCTPKQQPKAGVGYWVKAGPGVYTVKFKQSFPFGYIDFNPHEWGYPSIGIGDDIFSWKGVLETVPVTIKIAEEDSQDASPEKISEKFPHANPLGLDDETLIKLFNTGKALRRVGFDCESHYSEHKRLPKDIPDLAKRYEERSRHNIGNDPFAPGKKLHLVPVPNQPKKIRIWSVGPDGDWDGGRRIDSTKKPLDGDIGLECDLSQRGGTGGTFLADDTIIQCMQGLRLAHYLAAKGKKFPKPELKDDGLAWGPVVDGLQLAVELKPKRDFYYLGETIDVRFHIRNAADYAIQVGLTMHMKQDMGDGSVFIENEEGKRLKSKSVWMSGGVFTKQQVLKPGETATYESSNLAFLAPGKKPGAGAVGCWVEAGPGVYTVRFKQHFTDYFRADARQWNGELETGTVKVRIAKDPKFAIHLVKGYRHAGEGGPTSVTTYFFHNNNYKDKKYRLDTLKPENYPLKDLVLDGTPLVTEADLLAYDWDHHVMYLKPEAYKRLAKFKPNVWGVPFLVQSEGKPVYLGAFWSIISSYSADMPTINLSPLKYKAPENVPSELAKYAVQIRNSCISKPDQLPRDPRQSGRLQRALTEAGKISLKDAEELPHGEPVKKIQTRLRYGGTNYNDKSWFHFDLRNDSKDYTVPLGPAGIPTDILVDGVTYHWSGRVAGQLPICKPGQRVHEACFALDKDWSTKDKKGKLKQLDLTPGRHTIQAIIYAEGPPMFGRPNKVKVLSNLVEFEFTQPRSERTAWGKTVDGLQLGLVFESDSNPVFHAGETVHLGLFVRNTGKSPKQLAYLSRVAGTGFTLRDAEGNLIPISLPTIDIKALLQHQFLPPGRTVGLEDIHLELGEKSTSAKNPHVSLQPGKYRIGQTFSFHNASDVDFSGKLTSGELELVVAKPKSEASAEAKKLMQDPQAVAPQVKIQVEFPGHSPTEVEQLITTPLEKMLSQIDGVVSFDSVSRKDRVIITVRYKAGEDREQSLAELKKKINENGDLFPLGVASWVVKPVKSDSSSQSEHKKAAWGKPVEGVQSRLRPDDVHNSEPSFYFDLRNKSSNFSVQLGPNGRPIEILVDGTAYVWGTGIAGSLPVCKPGENSMGVQVKLNRNWVTKTIKGLPKTLAIKPGHHTVQAVVYAEGPDKRGRPQKMQVLSNAVEIEVPSEKETKEVASNVLTSGETVPSAQPSAKSSCFTLYRVKGYYPSKDHEKAAAIYFDGDKEKRFDPMQLEHYPLENLILDKKPLVTESDILSYDWDRHVILLKPEVHKRLAEIKPSVWGVPFLVQSEGKPIYLGAFWSIYSSYSADMPTIMMAPWLFKEPKGDPNHLPKNAIRINPSQIRKDNELPTDPRQDERLQRALTEAGKISPTDAEKLPHGKPVKKIQTRLRNDAIRDGVPWLYFDLRNDSKEFSVQLGPAGIPTEVLIDDVAYYWKGRVAGQLPVCKPGQRVYEARFGLGKDWYSMDKEGEFKQLDLTPGYHTVQAVVYAAGPPMFGRPGKTKVLSNPVKIEAIPQSKHKKAAWGKNVDGLQLGISQEPVNGPDFYAGKTAYFSLLLRNTGKKPKTIVDYKPFLPPPLDIKNKDGKSLVPHAMVINMPVMPRKQIIKPGEVIELGELHLRLLAKGEEPKPEDYNNISKNCVLLPPGKYRVRQSYAFNDDPKADFSGKLTTGECNFVVVAKPKSDASAELRKLIREAEARVHIAHSQKTPWGKSVEGVQSRLRLDDISSGMPSFYFDVRNNSKNLSVQLGQHGRPVEMWINGVPPDPDMGFGGFSPLIPVTGGRLPLPPVCGPGKSRMGVQFQIGIDGRINGEEELSSPVRQPNLLPGRKYKIQAMVYAEEPSSQGHARKMQIFSNTVEIEIPDKSKTPRKYANFPKSELHKKVPWNKPVEGIQVRLQHCGLFANEKSRLSFDLRNHSKELTVQLGPGGIPLEILVNGTSYHWEGRVTGKMPICKPGEEIDEALFQLHQDWFTKDKNGKNKPLKLLPGEYDIQAVAYAKDPKSKDPNATGVRIVTNKIGFIVFDPDTEKIDPQTVKTLTVDLIDAEGNYKSVPSYWIGYEHFTKEALSKKIAGLLEKSPELKVMIRSSKDVPSKSFMDLIKLLSKLDVQNISMTTFPVKSVFALDPAADRTGTIRGKVTGFDDPKLPSDYVVYLEHKDWKRNGGELPNMTVKAGETFEFRNLPPGEYTVRSHLDAGAVSDKKLAAELRKIHKVTKVTVKNGQVADVKCSFETAKMPSDSHEPAAKLDSSKENADGAIRYKTDEELKSYPKLFGTKSVTSAVSVRDPGPGTWGNMVDMVQCRLTTSKTMWKVGQTPKFEVDLRNLGKRSVEVDFSSVAKTSEVQYDGVWYQCTIRHTALIDSLYIEPGVQCNDIDLTLGHQWTRYDKDKKQHVPLVLKPGRHNVRFAFRLYKKDRKGTVRLETNSVQVQITKKYPKIAWGKVVDGLQTGLALAPSPQHDNVDTFDQGKSVLFDVYVRNTTKKPKTLDFPALFPLPHLRDAQGKEIGSSRKTFPLSGWPTKAKVVQPGEVVKVGSNSIYIRKSSQSGDPLLANRQALPRPINLAPGTYRASQACLISERPDTVSDGMAVISKSIRSGEVEFTVLPTLPDTLSLPPNLKMSIEQSQQKPTHEPVFTFESAPDRTGTIRGRVICNRNPEWPIHYMVYLEHEDWKFMDGLMPCIKVLHAKTFEFRNLTPGKYTVRAQPAFNSLSDKELAKKLAKTYRKIEITVEDHQTVDIDLSFHASKPSCIWGQSEKGVQCCLTAKKKIWQIGQTPQLEAALRNQGKLDVKMGQEPANWEIEYDGHWYRSTAPLQLGLVKTLQLKPGSQRDGIDLLLGKEWEWRSKDQNQLLEFYPGNHTIRAAFKLHTKDGKPLRVVSPPIEFEISPMQTPNVSTVWGKTVDDLQLGLTPVAEEKSKWVVGETVRFTLSVRNTGKKPAEIQLLPRGIPTVKNAKSEPMRVLLQAKINQGVRRMVLEPGAIYYLCEVHVYNKKSPTDTFSATYATWLEPGKYRVSQHYRIRKLPKLALVELDSGEPELTVVANPNFKPRAAWGKVVDDLQLGLAFDPVDKSSYQEGETVRLELLVRNTYKNRKNLFINRNELLSNPPAVYDAGGKRIGVSLDSAVKSWMQHKTIQPFQTLNLGHVDLALDTKGNPHVLLPPGKYTVCQTYPFHKDPKADFSGELTTGKLVLTVAAKPKSETSETPTEPKETAARTHIDRSQKTSWGETVDGMQLGLKPLRKDKSPLTSIAVPCKLYVRNNNKTAQTFFYTNPIVNWHITIRNAKNPENIVREAAWRIMLPVVKQKQTIQPGEVFELGDTSTALPPDNFSENLVPPGEYLVSQTYNFVDDPEATFSGKLTSGRIEITVSKKDEPHATPPAPEEKPTKPTTTKLKAKKIFSVQQNRNEGTLDVAFAPDGQQIAMIDKQSKVGIYNIHGMLRSAFKVLKDDEKKLLLHEDRKGRLHQASVAFSPDGYTLAAGADPVVRLYDAYSGRPLKTLNDELLIPALKDLKRPPATVSRELKLLQEIPHAHGRVYDLTFSPDGTLLGTSGNHLIRSDGSSVIDPTLPSQGKLKIWNVKTGKRKYDLGKYYSVVHALAFSPDGKTLASIGDFSKPPSTKSICLWNAQTGTFKKTYPIANTISLEGPLVFSPDGKLLVAGTLTSEESKSGYGNFAHNARLGASYRIMTWDVQTGKLLQSQKTPNMVTSLSFSADGETLAAVIDNEGVFLWEPKTLHAKGKISLPDKQSGEVHVAFSPTDDSLAVGINGKKSSSLTLWKVSEDKKE